jgi:hypothetical protein
MLYDMSDFFYKISFSEIDYKDVTLIKLNPDLQGYIFEIEILAPVDSPGQNQINYDI